MEAGYICQRNDSIYKPCYMTADLRGAPIGAADKGSCSLGHVCIAADKQLSCAAAALHAVARDTGHRFLEPVCARSGDLRRWHTTEEVHSEG